MTVGDWFRLLAALFVAQFVAAMIAEIIKEAWAAGKAKLAEGQRCCGAFDEALRHEFLAWHGPPEARYVVLTGPRPDAVAYAWLCPWCGRTLPQTPKKPKPLARPEEESH